MRPLRDEKATFMAIYHLSVKPISRSAGRSATASAAYRAGCQLVDERTGEAHDFTRKRGVESADVVLPGDAPEWALERSALWNAAERAEKRKDACVAREVEVALPAELSPSERRRLALDFAKEMANADGCAVDVAIHKPNREGDDRNFHAHMMRTTRKIGAEGLTEKLDTEKAGRNRRADLNRLRERWAELTNERLLENGVQTRIDHRSLAEQEIDRVATVHLGPAVMGLMRRGVSSHVQKRIDEEVEQLLRKVQEKARQAEQTGQNIIDLSTDIAAAKMERRLADRTATLEAKADARIMEWARAEREELQRLEKEQNGALLAKVKRDLALKQAIDQQKIQDAQEGRRQPLQDKCYDRSQDNDGPGF